jgi:DNA-binding transcriptional ArsR family regulator
MTRRRPLVNIEVHRYAAAMPRTPRTPNEDPEIRLLSALADPTRLAIVRELAATSETCACDFTSTCDVGQPTVSHHLRVLREAGVVTSERRGQWIYYRLAPDVAERLAIIARGMVPGGLIPVADLVGRRGDAKAGQPGSVSASA